MLKKIVLDLETQKEFSEVGGKGKLQLLKVSVCGIYDYSTDRYLIYEENELPRLGPLLQTADQIIGFNIIDFDYNVLQPYLNFKISDVPTLDLLVEIEKTLGHRISLDTVAQGTLGSGKSGNGLEAVRYFKTGRIDELKKYCLDDVKITKQVYDYALANQKLLYKDFFKTKEVSIKIEQAKARAGVMHQTALF